MFKTPGSRTALRTAVAAILAGLGALGTALIDNSISAAEWVGVATSFFGALALWLGIGAGTPTEPFFGRMTKDIEVPVPPADPVPGK